MLIAYLDASFTDAPVRISAVAGYLATDAEWQRVEAEWNQALRSWQIPRFHYADLPEVLGYERARLCIRYFERIIEASSLTAIGGALLDADWEKDDWGVDETEKLSSRYTQALEMAIECVAVEANRETVTLVCDQDAPSSESEVVYRRVQRKKTWLEGLMIGSSRRFLPLQFADLAAGKLRQSWREIARDPACELTWGTLPKGIDGRNRTAFWSLRGGAVINRSLRLQIRKLEEQLKTKIDHPFGDDESPF